jgi:hypothetical protein
MVSRTGGFTVLDKVLSSKKGGHFLARVFLERKEESWCAAPSSQGFSSIYKISLLGYFSIYFHFSLVGG